MSQINYDLGKITPGERLWLWRRRQESPLGRRTGRGGRWMSANEAAAKLRVHVNEYDSMEKDEVVFTQLAQERGIDIYGFQMTVGDLCLIARRRSGIPIAQLQMEVGGISRPTFNKLERAGDPSIISLWEEHGYIFP
jgi:hypothetical protein